MQTPEPEGTRGRASACPLSLGHGHGHSTGDGEAPGTRDTGEGQGTPPANEPGGWQLDSAGQGRVAQGARLVAASPPLLSFRTKNEDLGPANGQKKGGAVFPCMRPGREPPPPFRGWRAPVSHRKLINKLQSKEKGGGSLGRDFSLPSPVPPPRSVQSTWFSPGPDHWEGGDARAPSLYRWCSLRLELPASSLPRD